MSSFRPSRRRFLTGALAGGAALTLPLPRLAGDLDTNGTAWANGTDLPQRFGVWFFGNGIDPATWHPEGNGGTGDQWTLPTQLAALQPFKEYLTVLSGYSLLTGGAHVGGAAGIMTAAQPNETGGAKLPSIDQIVASRIGGSTPFRSLEVGLSKATPAGSQPCLHAISHAGPNAPNYPEYDPHRLFARLFGVGATSPELRQAKRSVLDTVLEDFHRLEGAVGAADRARLQAHADGIRELERRLESTPSGCGLIQAPDASVQADDREEAPAVLNDVMSRLMATALACDLTNVFSYAFTLPAGHVYYRHLGAGFDRSFHEDIVHLVDALDGGYLMVAQGVDYAMQCFATMLTQLRDTPTAIGGNLLDDLSVLCTSEVSAGWTHEMEDFPLILAGRACGRLRGDMHHVAPFGTSTTEVLVTLANLHGAGLTEMGADEAFVRSAGISAITT